MSSDNYNFVHEPGPGSLVFAFHGTGGDERQMIPLARTIWPDAEIIAPRGDVSEFGALRYFRRKAEGVYDYEDLAHRTATMVDFARAFKSRAAGKPVVGFGYSNGANILASTVFADPSLFDEVALLHPLVPWRPADDPRLAAIRVLITAGEQDPICPPQETRALADFLTRQGADTELEWHDGGHALRESEIDALKRWSSQEHRQKGQPS